MKRFQIWWLQVVYMIVNAGFISILYVYFVKNELNFWHIIFAEGLGYLFAVLFIAIKHDFSTKRDISFGYVLVLLGIIILLIPIAPVYILIPYMILKISGAIMFFTPYNILFFEQTNRDKKVHKMTIYWSIGTLVGILAPVGGGYLFHTFGLSWFVVVAVILLCISLYLVQYAKQAIYIYNLKTILTHIKGVRIITMLDGGLQNTSQLLITLFLLKFISDEFDFGKLLSVIALISIIFSFQVAHISDTFKKRVEFIWPLSLFSASIMIFFYFVNGLIWSVVLILIFKFISILFNPIRSNILFDKVENTYTTWISREIYLNIGRFVILSTIAWIVYLGFLRESFIVIGILYILFPVIVHVKKIYVR